MRSVQNAFLPVYRRAWNDAARDAQTLPGMLLFASAAVAGEVIVAVSVWQISLFAELSVDMVILSAVLVAVLAPVTTWLSIYLVKLVATPVRQLREARGYLTEMVLAKEREERSEAARIRAREVLLAKADEVQQMHELFPGGITKELADAWKADATEELSRHVGDDVATGFLNLDAHNPDKETLIVWLAYQANFLRWIVTNRLS